METQGCGGVDIHFLEDSETKNSNLFSGFKNSMVDLGVWKASENTIGNHREIIWNHRKFVGNHRNMLVFLCVFWICWLIID